MVDLNDTRALLKHVREQTGNHNLGIGDNQNGFTSNLRRTEEIIKNYSAQLLNGERLQQRRAIDNIYQNAARMLEQEPGAASTIY